MSSHTKFMDLWSLLYDNFPLITKLYSWQGTGWNGGEEGVFVNLAIQTLGKLALVSLHTPLSSKKKLNITNVTALQLIILASAKYNFHESFGYNCIINHVCLISLGNTPGECGNRSPSRGGQLPLQNLLTSRSRPVEGGHSRAETAGNFLCTVVKSIMSSPETKEAVK